MNAMGSVSTFCDGELTPLPAEYSEPRWYAAYTCAQHEKRVAEQFTQRALENFLPQYASVRRWKDRRVRLELPLFPGYVFVRLALRERLRVLETPSVVRLACAAAQINAEPHAYLTAGRRVRIKCGPLAELEGVLVRRKNGLRVVVSLDLIARSAAVEVDAADIERIF